MFERVEGFEKIVQLATESVKQSGSDITLNFSAMYEFDVSLLRESQFKDVSGKAESWQSVKCPDHLNFSHGEYITDDGIPHVIDELKTKPDSNRALISLISQNHILKSGDAPIPSFMILQFNVQDSALYITCYFRALEITEFFRINLEEIRSIAGKIHESLLSFDKVRLNVIAFRAYIKPNIDLLERVELDRIAETELLVLCQNNLLKLPGMLREKARHSTVVSAQPLKSILGFIDSSSIKNTLDQSLINVRVRRLLQEAIKSGDQLQKLRLHTSHHNKVEKASEQFNQALNDLAKEIDRCLGR